MKLVQYFGGTQIYFIKYGFKKNPQWSWKAGKSFRFIGKVLESVKKNTCKYENV